MSFLCILLIDCLVSSKKDSNDGAGFIGILFIIGYLFLKLDHLKEYILYICVGKENVLIFLVISFSILILTYWDVMKIKHSSFFVGILFRVMLYIDIFLGIGLMVIAADKLGMPLFSYFCNIEYLEALSDSKGFIKSFIGTILYLVVKLGDLLLITFLIPGLQLGIFNIFRKIKSVIYK